MSFFTSMKISSSALAAQRIRMNLLSTNLANVQSTKGDDNGPYRRRDVVFSAMPIGESFEDILDPNTGTPLRKVQVVEIHKDTSAPRRIYNPSHPDADPKTGIVEMPNVQVMTEMVNMIAATRAFEANTTAMNQAKQMAIKSLEIGK